MDDGVDDHRPNAVAHFVAYDAVAVDHSVPLDYSYGVTFAVVPRVVLVSALFSLYSTKKPKAHKIYYN